MHEVLPITSGYRLALVYNLRRQGRGQLPEPPNYDTEQTRVAALLRQWSVAKDAPDDDSPEKLLYPLEHAYTPAELAFEALKGADAAVADVLVAAASAAAVTSTWRWSLSKKAAVPNTSVITVRAVEGGRMKRTRRTSR